MDQPQAENPRVVLHPEETAEAIEPPAAPTPAAPMIVVQYRRNWSASLLPPLIVIVIAVLLIVQTRLVGTRTPESPRTATATTPPAVADAHPRGTSPLASPSPVVVMPPPPLPIEAALVATEPAGPEMESAAETETAAEPPLAEPPLVEASPEPAPEPAPKPAVSRPQPAIGFVRPGSTIPGPGPDPVVVDPDLFPKGVIVVSAGDRRGGLDVVPPAPPTAADVTARLAAEAEARTEIKPDPDPTDDGPTAAEEAVAIREHREALVGMKNQLLEQDRRQGRIRKAEEARKLKVEIEEKRADFLRELGRILKERGSSSGPEIVALCARYGRSVPRESEIRAYKILKTANGYRLEPRARVELLRDLGWPESMILDELAHQQLREIGRRNGPRNRAEALAAAARVLLSIPLQSSSAAVAPNGAAAHPRPTIR